MSIDDLWYEQVNVAEQRRDDESLLNGTERMIRMREECPEISWGDYAVLRTNVPEVLAMRYEWRQTCVLTLHNFSGATKKVRLKVGMRRDDVLMDVFDQRHSRRQNDGTHRITLEPYGWRWYRVGGSDNTLDRSDLNIKEDRVLTEPSYFNSCCATCGSPSLAAGVTPRIRASAW